MKKALFTVTIILSILLSSCRNAAPDEINADNLTPGHETVSSAPVQPDIPIFLPDAVQPMDDERIFRLSGQESTPSPVIPTQPLVLYEMSDDLFDFTIILDGDVLKLPMPLEVFMSYGWLPKKELTGTLLPGDCFDMEMGMYGGFDFYRNDKHTAVILANFSDEIRCISNSTVYNIGTAWSNTTLELPHEIRVGESTMDDVIAAFGDPTDIYEYTDYCSIYYRNGQGSVWIVIDYRNENKVRRIEVENKTKIESDFISNKAYVYNEITRKESNYTTPSILGQDLTSFNVEISGDLYRIPAPVSAFLDNGWEFKTSTQEGIPGNRELKWVTLIKDGKELLVDLFNFNDKLLAIERCFVVNIDVYSHDSHARVTLPGEITIGTMENRLLELFGTLLEKSETYKNYRYYPVRNADILNNIYFEIEGDNKGIIKRIVISNIEY